MSVFGSYSKYYDLLYKDKDYQQEADYVNNLIQKYAPDAKTILDLGCGTGKHDLLFAQKGYHITGIDISEEMISITRSLLTSLKSEQFTPPKFVMGDIRIIRLNEKFDAVISLFHVMSYQTTNAALKKAFETAAVHLNPSGIFIFDCWYGPGVLEDPPAVRVKDLENSSIAVTRVAEPRLHRHQNTVDVEYRVWIKDKKNQHVEEVRETHCLRYLFYPEIENFLDCSGFCILEFNEFMKTKPPGKGKWNGCFVCRKK